MRFKSLLNFGESLIIENCPTMFKRLQKGAVGATIKGCRVFRKRLEDLFFCDSKRLEITQFRDELRNFPLLLSRDRFKGQVTLSYKKLLLFWGNGKTHGRNIACWAIVRPMKEEIEKKIGYCFQDGALLELAFTHRSFWNENRESCPGHNERLEFLGDAVLGMLVAEYLYQTKDEADEGSCSQMRASIVAADACATYVQKLGLGDYLLLGKGERLNTGKGRDSILADLFEALLAAIYLDSGYERVKKFFFTNFEREIEQRLKMPLRNWKAELQDYAQRSFQVTPSYELLEEFGPSHEKHFRVAVLIAGEKIGEGTGLSKKEAQVEAAKQALMGLRK